MSFNSSKYVKIFIYYVRLYLHEIIYNISRIYLHEIALMKCINETSPIYIIFNYNFIKKKLTGDRGVSFML